jgi:hypothetical protein
MQALVRNNGVTMRVSVVVVLLAETIPSAVAQWNVPTVGTGVATRSSASTGYGGTFQPSPITPPSWPSAWPAPNNGAGWGKVGTDLASVSASSNTLSSHFEASGFVTSPAQAPQYNVDTLGNISYVNPNTGYIQTFGTTIQNAK